MDIKIFEIMDKIRERKKIRNKQWAKAAWGDERCISRISEIRKIAKLNKLAMDRQQVGRSFSFSKFLSLVNGLKNIIGSETFIKELIKAIEKPNSNLSNRDKIFLIISVLPQQLEDPLLVVLRSLATSSLVNENL